MQSRHVRESCPRWCSSWKAPARRTQRSLSAHGRHVAGSAHSSGTACTARTAQRPEPGVQAAPQAGLSLRQPVTPIREEGSSAAGPGCKSEVAATGPGLPGLPERCAEQGSPAQRSAALGQGSASGSLGRPSAQRAAVQRMQGGSEVTATGPGLPERCAQPRWGACHRVQGGLAACGAGLPNCPGGLCAALRQRASRGSHVTCSPSQGAKGRCAQHSAKQDPYAPHARRWIAYPDQLAAGRGRRGLARLGQL